ncbi:hypothetical protein WN48_06521 [Eufriesea mexicana]|uniref:Uncharacterized protein n=1 Tax=Eufriesea mexicana TaxID=516756 RepID=A0A310SPC5_9HYME|nr:hypothetical protein WN48_06521 [Eufriesea mexicana]
MKLGTEERKWLEIPVESNFDLEGIHFHLASILSSSPFQFVNGRSSSMTSYDLYSPSVTNYHFDLSTFVPVAHLLRVVNECEPSFKNETKILRGPRGLGITKTTMS